MITWQLILFFTSSYPIRLSASWKIMCLLPFILQLSIMQSLCWGQSWSRKLIIRWPCTPKNEVPYIHWVMITYKLWFCLQQRVSVWSLLCMVSYTVPEVYCNLLIVDYMHTQIEVGSVHFIFFMYFKMNQYCNHTLVERIIHIFIYIYILQKTEWSGK